MKRRQLLQYGLGLAATSVIVGCSKSLEKAGMNVSIRPFPIVGIARHEVAAHQYPYLYGLAAV